MVFPGTGAIIISHQTNCAFTYVGVAIVFELVVMVIRIRQYLRNTYKPCSYYCFYLGLKDFYLLPHPAAGGSH